MSNNCPVTRSRSSVLSDNFWKSGYPNLILSGFGRDRNLAVMLDLSSSRPPASYWRGRTGQCWGWEPEVARESGKSFISQQLVTCWNFLQFLEENEIIDSRISSNVGCQEVRDVEHHSEHATPTSCPRKWFRSQAQVPARFPSLAPLSSLLASPT